MGRSEEIDAERKPYESDVVWEARRAFLFAHWDDYPKEERHRLECLSQLFINVNMIGCDYSPSLMAKIREMSAGIQHQARCSDDRKYVKASRGRAVAAEIMEKERKQREEEKKPPPREPKDSGSGDQEGLLRIKTLKAHMVQAEKVSTTACNPLSLMNMATRVNLHWSVVKTGDGFNELTIGPLLVFRHKFIFCKEPRDEIIASVVESFISCEPSVSSAGEVLFDETPPQECYISSVKRRIAKSARYLDGAKGYKQLSDAFTRVGLKLEQTSQRGQGWSEQVDIHAGELLIASKMLSRGDCKPAVAAQIIDGLMRTVCEAIRSGRAQVINDESGTKLTY